MPSGDLNISMTADEKDLLKGQAKVIKQQDDMIEGYKKMLREAKNAAKQGGTELERFAAKTNKINKAPAQKYREEMDKLNRALKAGLINQETYNAAVRRAGDAHRSATGGDVIASFGTVITAVMGIKKAWDYVGNSIQKANEERRRYADAQTESAGGLGELAQLADTPEDLKRMVNAAKRTFAEGGAATLGDAAKLQFSLESAGISKYRKDVSALQATGVVGDATELVNAAAALEASLGTGETGTFRDIVSKGFGASKVSPARMEQIVQAAARSGSQAKALGLTDEELLASVASISKVEGSADMAGTQVESLLKQIEKYGIGEGYLEGGKTLKEQVSAIQKLVEGGTDVREILGDRQEGIKAFRTLAGKEGGDLYRQALSNIDTAAKTDAFGAKVQMARTADPIMAAVQLKKRTSAAAELSATTIGIRENLADALTEDLVADLRNRGKSEFKIQEARKIFGRQRGQDVGDWINFGGLFGNTSDTFLQRFGQFASPETRQQAEAVGVILQQSAEDLRGASADIRSAAAESAGSQTNAARARQAGAGGATEAR